uniref:Protein transport protein Sec31A n=1 Tax=Cyprinus carpio TaxID=7962 RepID=A0A8C2KEW7_CYPCA
RLTAVVITIVLLRYVLFPSLSLPVSSSASMCAFRGVLAIAWSEADPELLLSCGKDNRILCWNPNTAEVLYELPTSTQWCFDIQWCPRNPAVLSAAAFDGHISIYSIMGGSNDHATTLQAEQLSNAASFFLEYCQSKTEAAQSEFEKTVWSFLKVNFEEDARGKYLDLLGYKKEELALKVFLFLLKEVTFLLKTSCLLYLSDIDGLITQALLTGDYEAAVNLCLHDNRMADGIILAIAGGPELLAKTQKKYFSKTQSKISKLISAVVMKDWLDILETCDLQNWKEALAAVMTYAKPEEFSSLCGVLGSRLEAAEDTALQAQACLCYICAGTVEQLVAHWAKAQDSCSPLSLQELVEKVVVLQRAVLRAQGGVSPDMGALMAEKMNQYASLLASQGSLQTAISYLPTNTQQVTVRSHCPQQFTPAAGTPGIYQPLQYSSSMASPLPPPPSSSSSSAAAVYPPQFMHPASAPPVISGPPQGQPFSPPPLSSGMSFQHGGPGSPTAYLPPPVSRFPGPQNGWNDPSALNRAPKKKKMPENFTPPAPITAPIMAPLGDPQVPAGQTMQTLQPQQQGPDQPVGPAIFTPIQQQPLGPPGRNPSMPQGNMEGAPGAPIGDVIKSIPTEKITKKPIPEEHLVLKTTFEGLIQKCLAAASDPQTKRKLDDAHKRLEYLYDKLREQTLSPAIVGGLHNMARSIECRCYTDGLNIHTHIVSSSNFSETSAFMPILKVVLTQANKLGV